MNNLCLDYSVRFLALKFSYAIHKIVLEYDDGSLVVFQLNAILHQQGAVCFLDDGVVLNDDAVTLSLSVIVYLTHRVCRMNRHVDGLWCSAPYKHGNDSHH